MTNYFRPKGEKAEVDTLADVVGTEIGHEVSYDDLSAALGRDIRKGRSPIYQLQKRMELYHNRTIENVPGKGYRVAAPQRHEHLGRLQHAKSRRALTRAHRKFSSADRTLLSDGDRQRLDALARQVGEMQTRTARLEIKTKEHDEAIQTVVKKAAAVEERLVQRLSSVEETLRKAGLSKPKAS